MCRLASCAVFKNYQHENDTAPRESVVMYLRQLSYNRPFHWQIRPRDLYER